jgi:hypothetical protein
MSAACVPGRRAAIAGLLAAAVTLYACGGGGGPQSPSVAEPGNPIRFEDPAGHLQPYEAALRDLISSTLARTTAALPLSGVTITVRADARGVIPGYGLGGFTGNAATVDLYVDPAFPGLAQLLPERLPRLVAHELHHAKRFAGPGYGRTLLEALVSEGLADRFAMELLGTPVPPWSQAFPPAETSRYLDVARPELDSPSYDHARWFFGASPDLPNWTGYTLGFRLVEAYQAAHPGATAASLVNTPASAFRP